jgi:hypothetical protein
LAAGGGGKESIAIDINPVNAATGVATKKRGIVIRSASELEEISRILTDSKLSEDSCFISIVLSY